MNSLLFALGVAVLAFGAGVLGLKLHEWLPEKHAPEKSREMIGAMTGLLGLLLALVLGTLVGSAYSLYAIEKSEIETLAARSLQLDSALEALRPRGRSPGRDGLRKAITRKLRQDLGPARRPTSATWTSSPSSRGARCSTSSCVADAEDRRSRSRRSRPPPPPRARSQQTRILMDLQLASGVNWPMLSIVVCWSLLLFCGYGLVSPLNATVVVSMALGAIAVASALFLIIELTDPFVGLLQAVSRAGRRNHQGARLVEPSEQRSRRSACTVRFASKATRSSPRTA